MTDTEKKFARLTPAEVLLRQQERERMTQEAASLFKRLSAEDQRAYLSGLRERTARAAQAETKGAV